MDYEQPTENSPGGDFLVGRQYPGARQWQLVSDWPTRADAEADAERRASQMLQTRHAVFSLVTRYDTGTVVNIERLA